MSYAIIMTCININKFLLFSHNISTDYTNYFFCNQEVIKDCSVYV